MRMHINPFNQFTAATPMHGAMSLTQRVLGAIAHHRAETEDLERRRQMAELDPQVLRDIGITDDEMIRVRAMDRFTPASWQ